MRIAIDARWIFPEKSGIGVYTQQLIVNLMELDHKNEYFLLFSNANLAEELKNESNGELPDNFKILFVDFGVFSLKNQLKLPGLLKKNQIDIFHSTNYMIPFLAFPRNKYGNIKCITTIHDVIPLIFPHHSPKSLKSRFFPLFVFLMLETGKRSDVIITDSNSSAKDIIKHLKIPSNQKEKIKVIYCGRNKDYKPLPYEKKQEQDFQTILYVGRNDPYKNLTVLIEAFSLAKNKLTKPTKLIIAGSPDKRYPEGPELAKKLNLLNDIIWTGYLSDDELLQTFQTADLLVHPSQYEGFGLPVLEAMACGIPVISSNASSLPEVGGDAVIYVSPNDIDKYAENIVNVLNDKNLAKKLAQKGTQQAAKFSWEKTAGETLAIYESF